LFASADWISLYRSGVGANWRERHDAADFDLLCFPAVFECVAVVFAALL
jgi:hypothetical protein